MNVRVPGSRTLTVPVTAPTTELTSKPGGGASLTRVNAALIAVSVVVKTVRS
jgi:hypothetical protein